MFYPQFVYLYIKRRKPYCNVTIVLSIMALAIIILHKLLKLFVYIHFQFGNSALSFAHLNRLPDIEKLLVKHGAKEVSLSTLTVVNVSRNGPGALYKPLKLLTLKT